ncbi:hypothetical protein M0802_004750 [Mischocyttarus mexicanus]|nr:hypothetical protein M0802_004750 [Mischocyttarus mexicanus]
MKEHYTPRPSFLWSNENDQTVSNWTSPQLVNNKNQYQQFYIPEYNPNQNLCNLNHYQQEARNVYFQQLYMQIITIQQMFGNSLITSQQNNWQNPNYYYQKLPQLREQIIDVGINYHTTLFVNGISPYWMEGREPSKKTHGFVLTKRDEFIINDTIFEYVLRTYVHHPLYLIEAGYPCIWIFDARFQQFVNNLHIPFGYAMIGGYSSGGGNNGGQLATFVNKSNKMSTYKEENFKNNNEQQKRKQTRDLVRSSSFSSSSRRTFIDDTTTMTRQRSSTISTVSELNTFEIRCSMCLKGFYLYRANGDLNKQEVCVHHPGELIFNNKSKVKTWTCCNNRASVLGCKTYTTHLWKNFKKNFANSQIDFVRTKPSEIQSANHIYGIYGIDCEMVTTKAGLELAKVSLVNIHGYIVYNEYVIPGSEVIDYNTRFSGITPEILSNATKTLSMVQQDLLEYIKAETILIGHALENDLKVLRILHYTCIDTALLFKHPDELPFRHSLRALSKRYLQKIIQAGSHDSVEDTTAAINLVLFKLRDDGF